MRGEQLSLDLEVELEETISAPQSQESSIVPFVDAKSSAVRQEALQRVKRAGIFRSPCVAIDHR